MLPNSGQRCGEARFGWGQDGFGCGRAVDRAAPRHARRSHSTSCGSRLRTSTQADDLGRRSLDEGVCGRVRDNFVSTQGVDPSDALKLWTIATAGCGFEQQEALRELLPEG